MPYLLRIPLASGAVVLKAKNTWPRTNKIYCHPADAWPSVGEVDIVERVPVRSCVRRGVSVDLVLDRGRENRSQFVFTTARGREMVFWQSARTSKQARPAVQVPTARASGHDLHVLVDTRERYAWKFAETRQLAQEWTFRVVGAAVEHVTHDRVGDERAAQLVAAGDVPHRAPTPAEVRAWAADAGHAVSDRGRIPADVMRAYLDAHGMTG